MSSTSQSHTEAMKKFMKEAVEEASRGIAVQDGGPFGAIVVNRDGKIIARSHNMVLISNDPTAHAEVTAIRAACSAIGDFHLTGCTLYSSCHPCPMCLGACLWAGLDAVYYAATPNDAANAGFDDAKFYEYVRNPSSDTSRKLELLVVDGHLKPFEEWNLHPNKKLY